jgi:hypothetical protein
MATPSYRERMKAARAEARAKRLAEQSAQRSAIELRCEVRRLALNAVKAGIRARGELQLYSHAQLTVMANELIGPWLIEQVKAQIAARNLRVMSKEEKPATQGLPLNECHAQNGATK